MSEKEKTTENAQSVVFADWVLSQTSAWEEAVKRTARAWQAPFGAAAGSAEEPGQQPTPDEIGKGLFEFFQALASIAGAPKPGDIQGAKSVPDMMLKILQPFWGYMIKLERQWAEMTGATATGQPENMAEILKQMTKTFYESQAEDFRKILNIPQLGLNRYYQERYNRAIEKASDYQSALTEFFQLLMIPLEKAYYGVQEEIAKMEKEGKAAVKDSKALYQLWIQKLEDHYMQLLRSDDYMNTLTETLNRLHDYRAARAEFFMDLLQNLPIPTNRDMDELYHDLHILKKRVRELERKVKRNGK
ncbi:MAG: Poly(R)-hydroxyalkanoic acid synthase subunit (PHA_synth_III_E) [Firmicutes bacterium ADurb.Bin153]|nr:MAG: Poly(R)-hydroxyalkanoic acid synthase subunit (PHA_synth_III_E) [Firmicutes bacterium ADurb.Bin153]